MTRHAFPLDLLAERDAFEGKLGDRIRAVSGFAMTPPYPWGHWTYGGLVRSLRKCDGDFAELGVGFGGLSVLLGWYAKDQGRRMWSFDSFEGLPPPRAGFDNPYFSPGDFGPRPDRKVDLETQFRRICARNGVSETVHVVKGFFDRTLAHVDPSLRFAFVHLDSDLYDSVMQSLEFAWPRLADGGIIAIDDFFHHAQGPARAVRTFFDRHALDVELEVVFPYSVFVRKGRGPSRKKARRSLDGHTYSFAELRKDRLFRTAVEASARRRSPEQKRARSLLAILERDVASSADVYDYWSALAGLWDMFEHTPATRPPRLL